METKQESLSVRVYNAGKVTCCQCVLQSEYGIVTGAQLENVKIVGVNIC